MAKRVASTIVLSLLSTLAIAQEWVFIYKTSADRTVYVDAKSIRFDEGFLRAWTLNDYPKAQQLRRGGEKYKSAMVLYRLDCVEEKISADQIHAYSGNMRQGKNVFNDTRPTEMVVLPPGSPGQILLNFVCRQNISVTTPP